jgi:hypothetical protein
MPINHDGMDRRPSGHSLFASGGPLLYHDHPFRCGGTVPRVIRTASAAWPCGWANTSTE